MIRCQVKALTKHRSAVNGKELDTASNREVALVKKKGEEDKSPRYADLACRNAHRKRDKASIDTLREFFGGGNAGNIRADTFS